MIDVLMADYGNPAHARALVDLLDAYAATLRAAARHCRTRYEPDCPPRSRRGHKRSACWRSTAHNQSG